LGLQTSRPRPWLSEEEKVLDGMIAWMRVNGEALYGARPWRILREGPPQATSGQHTEAQQNFASRTRGLAQGVAAGQSALRPGDGLEMMAARTRRERQGGSMRDRRQVLLGLAFALGGPTALASCDSDNGDAILTALRPNGRLAFYKSGEFRLVGVIADAIIPRTDTPGAIEVGVPGYIDVMMNVWASDDTKREHRASLRAIGDALGRGFLRLPDAQRRAAVAELDAAAFAEGGSEEGSAGARYRALKSLIANVYYASEPGATQELQYELVPGRWLGDAPLSQVGRTWYE
jgi:gluconate 2-dehydrogenase gamma chain